MAWRKTHTSPVSVEGRDGTVSITRPEIELLLHCARTRMKAVEKDETERLVLNIKDWDYLLRTAYRHGLMPLLYYRLRALGAEFVPAAWMAKLRDQFHRNAARNLLLTEELHRILSLLEENGVTAIPFKGPALALTLYGDTAFRQFVDLDILIRQHDLPKTTELLLSRGYSPAYRMNSAREAAYLRAEREQLFTHPAKRFHVEIHWAFAAKPLAPDLDSERFWERLEETALDGTRTRALAPEDLLLILCVHGGKHFWERLGWLCDMAELIAAHTCMDWEKLLAEAGVLGVRRMLLLGLLLVNDLLKEPLPETLRREIEADPAGQSLARQVLRKHFPEVFSPLGLAESIFFNYKIRERRRDGARYCYYITIPPTPAEWASLDLPDNLSFLYYLIRPVRMIKKHAASSMRRFAGF